MIIEKVDINRKIVATSCLKNSYKNFAQLFLQGKPLTYRAFFDIIAQNKYRTDVLCNLYLFILCVNDII